MEIVVCIKSVMTRPGENGVRSAELCELNPFDRPALSLALELREELGGKVTALSMGPAAAEEALREALALGVDRAVLVSDPALAGSDTLATSLCLAAAVRKLKPDLLLFGTRSADSDTGQIGPQTATALKFPLLTGVLSVKKTETGFEIERRCDGFHELFQAEPPLALTVHPTVGLVVDPSLSGLERAYATDQIERWSLADVGIAPDQVGERGSATRVLSLRRVKRERKGEWLHGSAEEQAQELVKRLLGRGLLE